MSTLAQYAEEMERSPMDSIVKLLVFGVPQVQHLRFVEVAIVLDLSL